MLWKKQSNAPCRKLCAGTRAKAGGGISTGHKKAEDLATLRALVRKHAGETKTAKEQQQQQAKTHTREMKTMKNRFQQQRQQQAKTHTREMKTMKDRFQQQHQQQQQQATRHAQE